MEQEWRLYNVRGARNVVRLLLNTLIFIIEIILLNLLRLTLSIRLGEEHGVPTLMMVGNKETA